MRLLYCIPVFPYHARVSVLFLRTSLLLLPCLVVMVVMVLLCLYSMVPPEDEDAPSHGEDPQIVRHSKKWVRAALKRYPKRNVQAIAANMDGDAVLISRYLVPQVCNC